MAEEDKNKDSKKSADDLKAAQDAQAAAEALADKAKDDLAKADTSKFSGEQKDDYIDKLKDENARRRIDNKKIKDNAAKLVTDNEEAQNKLTEANEELAKLQGKEKKRTDAEKSDIEKLVSEVADIKKGIDKRDTEITSLKSENKKKDLKLENSDRRQMVDRLADKLGIEFTSDYERQGLLIKLLERKDGVYNLNDDELLLDLQDLAKERKKNPPTKTPGPGPQSRTTDKPLITEIKELTTKDNLTADENKRLDELIDLAEEARQQKMGQG